MHVLHDRHQGQVQGLVLVNPTRQGLVVRVAEMAVLHRDDHLVCLFFMLDGYYFAFSFIRLDLLEEIIKLYFLEKYSTKQMKQKNDRN